MHVKVTFPDGTVNEYESGITVHTIAEMISKRLSEEAVCAKVDENLVDMDFKIEKDCKLKILKFSDEEGKHVFWHSATHLMAHAIVRLFPTALLTIGPTVDDGFYYDIDKSSPFTPDDIPLIEAEMSRIAKEDYKVKRIELSKEKAKELFKDNSYKIELIEEFGEDGLSAYQQGDFIDLCRGPHAPSTGFIKAFKIMKFAAAYWRADQSKQQLQRLYGIAFPSKKELDAFVKLKEEAEKRDHRKLGKELELFMMHEFSPGSPFFLPNGTIIYNELVRFIREQYFKRNYLEIITPTIFDKALWEASGHWSHYKENMFLTTVDNREFSMKPMNCPGAALVFKSRTRSYKDLPLRFADFGFLHRNELSGVLGGLMRVRRFEQDDSHTYCTMEQVESEIINLLDFVKFVFKDTFNFNYSVELSTRPEKYLGEIENWDKAEEMLKNALAKNNIAYKLKPGDGAFYGPKIDFHVKDAIGRSWQLATVQLDFNQGERFDLHYEGSDGKQHRPIVIHKAILGSLQRFIGVLIEHFEGKFPLWLAPEQVRVLTVADRFNTGAQKFADELKKNNIRAGTDFNQETIPKKVRDAQLAKVPLIIIIGEKEESSSTVSVRTLDGKVQFGVKVEDFIATALDKINKREI
jgi:threonyl-tRNA synthetase